MFSILNGEMSGAEANNAVFGWYRAARPRLASGNSLIVLIGYEQEPLSLMITEAQRLAASASSDGLMLYVKVCKPLLPVVQRLIIRYAQR
ncbi:hypothetical protein D3C81_1493180 [compost metagenome]